MASISYNLHLVWSQNLFLKLFAPIWSGTRPYQARPDLDHIGSGSKTALAQSGKTPNHKQNSCSFQLVWRLSQIACRYPAWLEPPAGPDWDSWGWLALLYRIFKLWPGYVGRRGTNAAGWPGTERGAGGVLQGVVGRFLL